MSSSEPRTWTFTDTDSSAGLQHAGVIGLRAATSSTSTNVPITFRFDNLTVLDLGAGATPSVAQLRSSVVGDRATSKVTLRTSTAIFSRIGRSAR